MILTDVVLEAIERAAQWDVDDARSYSEPGDPCFSEWDKPMFLQARRFRSEIEYWLATFPERTADLLRVLEKIGEGLVAAALREYSEWRKIHNREAHEEFVRSGEGLYHK